MQHRGWAWSTVHGSGSAIRSLAPRGHLEMEQPVDAEAWTASVELRKAAVQRGQSRNQTAPAASPAMMAVAVVAIAP